MENRYVRVGKVIQIECPWVSKTTGEKLVYRVLIDAEDLQKVFGYKKWRILKSHGGPYCVASEWHTRGVVCMHRLLKSTPAHLETKNLNGNSLDCRKNNWVICEHKGTMAGARSHGRKFTGETNIEPCGRGFLVNYHDSTGKRRKKMFGILEDAVAWRDENKRKIKRQLKRQEKELLKGHQTQSNE